MNKYKIAVFCEMQRNDTAAPVSYELVSKAVQLARNIENPEIVVIIVGRRINYDNIINNFSACGANKIIVVNDNLFTEYSSERYRKAVCKILEKENPEIFLIGATVVGRDLAPLVATTLGTGLTADCTELEIVDGKLAATRPTFGGKLNATILCKTKPQMATVRPSVFKKIDNNFQNSAEVRFDWVDTNSCTEFTKVLAFLANNKQNNLSNAKIILSGGKGLKTKENFDKLYKLANLLNASVGASRGAVEAKFANSDIQIGQTGKTVSAKVYIAFGISGMTQHVSGINSCDKIIAVNNNPNAPIFKTADYGIVGDASEILSAMIEQFSNKNGECYDV